MCICIWLFRPLQITAVCFVREYPIPPTRHVDLSIHPTFKLAHPYTLPYTSNHYPEVRHPPSKTHRKFTYIYTQWIYIDIHDCGILTTQTDAFQRKIFKMCIGEDRRLFKHFFTFKNIYWWKLFSDKMCVFIWTVEIAVHLNKKEKTNNEQKKINQIQRLDYNLNHIGFFSHTCNGV